MPIGGVFEGDSVDMGRLEQVVTIGAPDVPSFMMPETGGIGTAPFVIMGMVLAALAGAAHIGKKREWYGN